MVTIYQMMSYPVLCLSPALLVFFGFSHSLFDLVLLLFSCSLSPLSLLFSSFFLCFFTVFFSSIFSLFLRLCISFVPCSSVLFFCVRSSLCSFSPFLVYGLSLAFLKPENAMWSHLDNKATERCYCRRSERWHLNSAKLISLGIVRMNSVSTVYWIASDPVKKIYSSLHCQYKTCKGIQGYQSFD